MRRFLLTALFLVWLPLSLFANDWPQWRGSQGNGVSSATGLPEVWSETGGLAWKAEIAGQGVSTPIVVGDLVVVTSQIGRGNVRPGNHPTLARGEGGDQFLDGTADENQKVVFLVEAFDRASGERRWQFRLDASGELPGVHQKSNMASPSAVSDGQRVVAWFGTGQLVALSLEGKLLWERDLADSYSPFEIGWGHASSPAIYRDLVILQCDHTPASYLVALELQSGKERWKVDRGSGLRSYSTPTIVSSGGKDELVVNSSERLDAYDPATGAHLWFTGENNRFPIPVPSAHDGVIYTSRGYRSGPYMAIKSGGSGDISDSGVLWKVSTGAPYVSSIVHYQGLIYMANGQGIAQAVDAANGETVWQERVGGVYSASPVAGDGKIYFFSESGEALVLAGGREFRILSRNQLDGRFLASPAIAGKHLFVRTDRHLYSISGSARQ